MIGGVGLAVGAFAVPPGWDYLQSKFGTGSESGSGGWQGEKVVLAGYAPVTSLRFAPDRSTLAVGYQSGEVRLWDLGTAKMAQTLEVPGVAHSLAFSSDGELLATAHGSSFGGGAVWRLSDGEKIASVGDSSIGAVAFAYDDSALVTSEEAVRVWDAEIWKDPQVLQNPYSATEVAVSPAVPLILVGGGGKIYMWGLDGSQLESFRSFGLADLKFNPAGTVIAAIGNYGGRSQTVWHKTFSSQMGNGDQVTDVGGRPASLTETIGVEGVDQFDFNHDGTLLATSGESGLQLWTIETGDDGYTSTGFDRTLTNDAPGLIAFSRTDSRLAGVGGLDLGENGGATDSDVWVITL